MQGAAYQLSLEPDPELDRYVDEIIAYLDAGRSLEGIWEPLRILLTCYQVLRLTPDARAGEILETAYQKLQQQASIIPDRDARQMFLENVPWNREIIAAHREVSSV